MFNILTDELPSEYAGVKVRTDFKQGIKFFKLMEDKDLTDIEKTNLIILCLFETIPKVDTDLWEFINYYISGGEETKQSGSSEKLFCFNQDADRVYSAFRQIYNMDLSSENLHWWEFLALFKCLPDGTNLARVIQIRSEPIDPKADSKTRAKMMHQKSLYALKTNETFSLNGFM